MKISQILNIKNGAIALISLIAIGQSGIVPAQDLEFDRFADWCDRKANLTPASRRTVEVLLEIVKTQDCQRAEQQLSSFTKLDLENHQLQDITPLSSLNNLTELNLFGNGIQDLSPISYLENLTKLNLGWNQIQTISSLSTLVKLTELHLDNNRIHDVTPLSSLTQLTKLNLTQNSIRDIQS